MKLVINQEDYFRDLLFLKFRLKKIRTDWNTIVCLKRSGFIMGAYLSNQLGIPLFTASEIATIPEKFKNILLVDDKICTGKSLEKVRHKLLNENKNITSACIYTEAEVLPDIYQVKLKGIHKMWYEV